VVHAGPDGAWPRFASARAKAAPRPLEAPATMAVRGRGPYRPEFKSDARTPGAIVAERAAHDSPQPFGGDGRGSECPRRRAPRHRAASATRRDARPQPVVGPPPGRRAPRRDVRQAPAGRHERGLPCVRRTANGGGPAASVALPRRRWRARCDRCGACVTALITALTTSLAAPRAFRRAVRPRAGAACQVAVDKDSSPTWRLHGAQRAARGSRCGQAQGATAPTMTRASPPSAG
jgi:hypothetical protein